MKAVGNIFVYFVFCCLLPQNSRAEVPAFCTEDLQEDLAENLVLVAPDGCGFHAPRFADPLYCDSVGERTGEAECLEREAVCYGFPPGTEFSYAIYDYCDCTIYNDGQDKVIHSLRAMYDGLLEEDVDEATEFMSAKLNSANGILRNSTSLEDSVSPCVEFSAEYGIFEGLSIAFTYGALSETCLEAVLDHYDRDVDGVAIVSQGLLPISTEGLIAFQCLLADAGIAVYFGDWDTSDDGAILNSVRPAVQGVGRANLGNVVFDKDANSKLLLHELGHVLGMGHYPRGEEYEDRLMYYYASRSEGYLSCRDANSFSIIFTTHPTLSSRVDKENRCEPLVADEDLDSDEVPVAGSKIPSECSGSAAHKNNDSSWLRLLLLTLVWTASRKKLTCS